jgi:hypothetical protein
VGSRVVHDAEDVTAEDFEFRLIVIEFLDEIWDNVPPLV